MPNCMKYSAEDLERADKCTRRVGSCFRDESNVWDAAQNMECGEGA